MHKPLAIASRNYAFLGTTQSLCPDCLDVVPAKIIARGKRVYFRKTCPTHGIREDFVCSDRSWYDRYDYVLPSRLPKETFTEAVHGCPKDCGLCSEHEQHTCVGVLEITDGCNLTCPMCYAASKPGQSHRTLEEVQQAIAALVRAEGRPDVLQLSGGEPTVHPQFESILDHALAQPIDYVMVNTNGIRLAKDQQLVEKLAASRQRLEIYFQMDGLSDATFRAIRGEPLLELKLRALERLGEAGLNVTLVCTLQAGVNDDAPRDLLAFSASRPWITGLSFQPATYTGRYVLPDDLERRITFPDVIQTLCARDSTANGAIGGSTDAPLDPTDFFPLPCAHPNCHILALLYRDGSKLVPLTRWFDAKANLDLLANGLSFTRDEGVRLAKQYLARNGCCGPGGSCGPDPEIDAAAAMSTPSSNLAGGSLSMPSPGLPIASHATSKAGGDASSDGSRFLEQLVAKEVGARQLLRVTITSFLDAYNFDVRRVMKCCTHHVLPSGHIIPFCAYNTLYRSGHVVPPPLRDAIITATARAD
jgi:7,8-dihydro-6-hydroxymethylpterin dimethyltransferase